MYQKKSGYIVYSEKQNSKEDKNVDFGSLFGCGKGINTGCFPINSCFGGFGGSWIWIIIFLCICNGDWFSGCGCKCKKRKKRDCCFGSGENWWIWILILLFFCCCQGGRQICMPQNDDCC